MTPAPTGEPLEADLRVLVIEDEPNFTRLLEDVLSSQTDPRFEFVSAATLTDGLHRLSEADFDAVVLDLGLPDSQGIATVVAVRGRFPLLPIIVLSATSDDTTVRDAMQAGAKDFIIKDRALAHLLPRSIRFAVHHHRTEERLRESEAGYRSLFENAVVGMSQALPDGRLIHANMAYARMYGYTSPDEMLAEVSHVQHLYARPEDRRTVLRVLEETGVLSPMEIPVVRRDGSRLTALVTAAAVKNLSGKVLYYQATHVDITARKRAEEELRTSREQLRALAVRLQAVREEERTHIAREIHDVLAQELTLLKIDLVWMQHRLAKPGTTADSNTLTAHVSDMVTAADTAIRSVQKIATKLRPAVLDSLGLCAAVEWLARDFQTRSGIEHRASVPEGELPVGPDTATAAFRILQESLTNVLRHANATRVDIVLRQDGDRLVLRVQDNGTGLPPETVNDPLSIGLVGMRERALLLGGELTIQSQPGGGTAVEVRLPLAHASDRTEGNS